MYVNQTTTNRPHTVKKVSGEEETIIYQLPAYKDVLVYEERPLEEEKDRELTDVEQNQVKTFYAPIRAELTGNDYRTLKLSEMLLTKLDKVSFTDASLKDVFKGILDRNIEKSYEALKYVTKE